MKNGTTRKMNVDLSPASFGDTPGEPLPYLEIRRIAGMDFEAVVRLFSDVIESETDQTFHPHAFDSQTARGICDYQGMDWYAGGFVCALNTQRMVAYVMLRGWDAGYTVPSFGVCVLPDYRGVGLGRTLLDVAIAVARLRRCPSIRLKVYPDNRAAVALYQTVGFEFDDDLEQGQLVGHLRLYSG